MGARGGSPALVGAHGMKQGRGRKNRRAFGITLKIFRVIAHARLFFLPLTLRSPLKISPLPSPESLNSTFTCMIFSVLYSLENQGKSIFNFKHKTFFFKNFFIYSQLYQGKTNLTEKHNLSKSRLIEKKQIDCSHETKKIVCKKEL